MKQVSFLHTADLHLDAPFSSLGDEEKARLRRSDIEAVLSKIVQKVQEDNINFLIISGDLFEDKYIKQLTLSKMKNMFSELYNTEIIIAPGNHDPISDTSYYRTMIWGSNVHILESSKQVLYFEKYNTCIYSMGITRDIQKDYAEIRDMSRSEDKFNILVFHGTVDIPFEEDNYNSIASKELFSLNMDYIALGHMHCYSEFKNARTYIINPGSPEPLGFDEEGEHGFVQGTIRMSEDNIKQLETAYITTALRHYHNVGVNISDCLNNTDVIERIINGKNSMDMEDYSSAVQAGSSLASKTQRYLNLKDTDLYSITLFGFINKSYSPDLGYILKVLRDRCFFIKIKNQTSVRLEYEQYLEDPGIKGEFVRRMLDQQRGESSKEKLNTLLLAMQYGLQALENERVDL